MKATAVNVFSQLSTRGVRRAALLTTVSALVALLASLAGGVPPAATADEDYQPVAGCGLLNESEARAAIGGDVHMQPAGTTCSYVALSASRYAAVGVASTDGADPETYAESMEMLADALVAQLRAAPDIGDEAWVVLGDTISQIGVRVGERAVTVLVMPSVMTPEQPSEDERYETLRDLAMRAVGRLP